MANTVSIISYANTFGDWVVTTNALLRENNDLAANNYTKSTGTLYLNDPTLGLQVGAGAIFAGALQVQGTGSSAFVQNNIRVDGQIQATNTSNSIYASGPIVSLNRITANGSGLGLSIANNATIGGILNTSSLFVTSNSTTGNIQVQGLTTTNVLTVNTSTYIGTSLVVGTTLSANDSVWVKFLTSNNSANVLTSIVVCTTFSSN
jgi:hypothetical protein